MAECTRPRRAWRCKRKAGHPGPCPTWPKWWNLRAHLALQTWRWPR